MSVQAACHAKIRQLKHCIVRKDLGYYLLLALAAGFAMLPSLFLGPMKAGSQQFNKFWMVEFHNELLAGFAYPRWLFAAWDGFGSPTFYFYPSTYFYATSIVRLLCPDQLSWHAVSTIVQGVLIFLSGAAMWRWLSFHASNRLALLGAVAFMIMPYHLNDFYLRGALAESVAYVTIPIIATEIYRLSRGHATAVPLLAAGYALLVLSHLPMALLVSLLLIMPYALFLQYGLQRCERQFLRKTAAALALGLAMSAVYLLPSLWLLPYVSSNILWIPYYWPEKWFFWAYAEWPNRRRMLFTILVTTGLASLAFSTWHRSTRLNATTRH